MSKPVKELISHQLRLRYGELDNVLWIELVGVDGITTNQFRRELRERQMRMEVVKNALFRRAVGTGPLAPLAEALNGPVALITGGASLIDAAKLIEQWKPKIKTLKMRGAVLDGEYLDETGVAGLARMPTRRDLQGRLSGCVLSPGANLSAAILAGGGNIAGCLKVLIEKLEESESAAAA